MPGSQYVIVEHDPSDTQEHEPLLGVPRHGVLLRPPVHHVTVERVLYFLYTSEPRPGESVLRRVETPRACGNYLTVIVLLYDCK